MPLSGYGTLIVEDEALIAPKHSNFWGLRMFKSHKASLWSKMKIYRVVGEYADQ
jgi:23S rRNA G2445 N2-methylase RlmL